MRTRLRRTLAVLCTICAFAVSSPSAAATLAFLSDVSEPSSTEGFSDVVVSPDGLHVYAYAPQLFDAAIAVFSRDGVTGALSLVEVETMPTSACCATLVFSPDGTSLHAGGSVFGRDGGTGELTLVQSPGPVSAVSPDGVHAYSGALSSGIRIWARDAGTGALTLLDELSSPASFNPSDLAVSSDGAFVYAADHFDLPAYDVRVFERDAVSGGLKKIQSVTGGSPRFDRRYAERVFLSPDESHLYVAVADSAFTGEELAVFQRDAVTGKLTFAQHLRLAGCASSDHACCLPDAVGGPEGLSFDPSGARAFALTEDAGISTLSRDATTGALGVLELQPTALLGPGTPRSAAISPDGSHFYIGTLERTVETYAVGASPATGIEVPCKIDGKSLTIKNSGAGGTRKSVKMLSKETTLPVGVPGSADDPMCNDDLPGTARATIRFSSDAGEDTGAIALPCERWETIGNPGSPSFGYRYRDALRLDGPCLDIKLQRDKLLKAKCDNRGAVPFDFDLTSQADQGIVTMALETATTVYCASFDDHKGQNGTSGKKFLGKLQPPPVACP